MRFLLDENVEYRLAAFLRELGHDVTAIAHDYPHALSDHEVLMIARSEQRILLTSDRDFGELIIREHLPHAGVIYLRFPPATFTLKTQRLAQVLVSHREQLDQFLVIDPAGARVRRTEA
jgi:predicted nuclease of predicted toxin-antitoxin system